MDKSQIDELKKICKEENISFSTLVQKTLKHYLEIDKIYNTFDWIKVPKDTLSLALKKLNPNEIEELGKNMALEFSVDFMLVKWGEITEYTIIEFLKIFFKENAWGELQVFSETEGVIINIKHGMGKKVSKLLITFIQTLFQNQLNRNLKVQKFEKMISISISNKPHTRNSHLIPKNINYSWYKSEINLD